MLIHMEVTTRCPLRCPQCYVDLTAGKDLPLSILQKRIAEAIAWRVPVMAFSGGEPLLYPYLEEAVYQAASGGIHVGLSTSGVGLDLPTVKRLFKAGLKSFFLSLNGSTKEIHSLSRDGYDETRKAMELLTNYGFPYSLNWVASQDNVDDFPHMVELAIRCGAQGITVLRLKPDVDDTLDKVLAGPAFFRLVDFLKTYRQEALPIRIESCYPELRLAVHGAQPIGMQHGCGAGNYIMAVDVEGNFRPCRHLDLAEDYASMTEYWKGSNQLVSLQQAQQVLGFPCEDCQYRRSCRPCRAVGLKVHGENIAAGMQGCPLARKEQDE